MHSSRCQADASNAVIGGWNRGFYWHYQDADEQASQESIRMQIRNKQSRKVLRIMLSLLVSLSYKLPHIHLSGGSVVTFCTWNPWASLLRTNSKLKYGRHTLHQTGQCFYFYLLYILIGVVTQCLSVLLLQSSCSKGNKCEDFWGMWDEKLWPIQQ